MREVTTKERIAEVIRTLGLYGRQPARVYFTGGSTAVMLGWRDSTYDIDLKLVPDTDELLRGLQEIKERLKINIELAAPSDFVPELPGWEDRSIHIAREGKLDFFHYDPFSQALSKLERGHAQDVRDVNEMLDRGLIDPAMLLELFRKVEKDLYKYPAIDGDGLRETVERFAGENKQKEEA